MIFFYNSIIKRVHSKAVDLVPFERGGRGLNGPVDLEEGRSQGRKTIDAIEIGIKG